MSSEIVLSRELLPPGSTVLCAVSGGADSVCLLHLVRRLEDVKCVCAHFDHGIRGEESRRDAAFVEELCRAWDIPFLLERGDVPAHARATGQSLETAGRELRYAFLRRAAAACGADRIATAHNLNDHAETVLFRMARGTGLRGLCGIPAERDGIVRPLLGVRREEIEAYLAERGIPCREDSTNREDGAARNRVRHRVLPLLESVHDGAAENIARMTETLREDEAFLTALAAEQLRAWGGERLPVDGLSALPRPVAARVLRLWLGEDLSRERLEAVLALCRSGPSARAELPGGTVRREYGVLLRTPADPAVLPEREVRPGETLALPEAGLCLTCEILSNLWEIKNSLNTFYFSCANICDKLTVASRREGEKIALHGREGTHSIKKLLIDARIPRAERGRIPVLRCGGRVLAVYGFGQAKDTLPREGGPFYKITIGEMTEEKTE